MGLIKEIPIMGYRPKYWFIKEIMPDFRLKRTSVIMGLYKDALMRTVDKSNATFDNLIDSSNYTPEVSYLTLDGVGLTREEMYKEIKENQQNTFFADAVDELTV